MRWCPGVRGHSYRVITWLTWRMTGLCFSSGLSPSPKGLLVLKQQTNNIHEVNIKHTSNISQNQDAYRSIDLWSDPPCIFPTQKAHGRRRTNKALEATTRTQLRLQSVGRSLVMVVERSSVREWKVSSRTGLLHTYFSFYVTHTDNLCIIHHSIASAKICVQTTRCDPAQDQFFMRGITSHCFLNMIKGVIVPTTAEWLHLLYNWPVSVEYVFPVQLSLAWPCNVN